jgi:enediyne biosynthesis protein E4
MSTGGRRWGSVLLLATLAGGVLWGGGRWWEVRRHRRAMEAIEDEMENGRPGTAARRLNALLAGQPDSDEVLCLLGTCEMARGHPDAADAAWARVPPASRFAPRAILGRMQIRMECGRLAEAEQIVQDALDDPRIDASQLPILLGPIYCQQGRLEETLRLIEARWDALNRAGGGASEEAINLVRAHIALRRSSDSIEMIRAALDQAAALAPEDDRVWLGKANLAIRLGSYDEAARWLAACLRRRPADVPVWRARLDWAVATNRVPEAREALEHLPAQESTPAQVQRLTAWLAARRGDRGGERRALERLIAVDPADATAWDRLVELAVQEGQHARVAELRGKKAEIDQLTARYHKLYQRNQPMRDAAEMAHLAEQLGLGFEARAFLTVAAAVGSGGDQLRRELAQRQPRGRTVPAAGRTLAEVLAAELEATAASSPFPTTSSAAEGPPAPIPRPREPDRRERRNAPG